MQGAALQQLVHVLRGRRQVGYTLRKLLRLHALTRKTLRTGDHLIRIEQHLAHPKALAQIEHRRFDGSFEIERVIRSWLIDAVKDQTDNLTFLSQVVATTALELCLTLASIPIQIGNSGSAITGFAVDMTHWSYQLMSTNVDSLDTKQFSIMRA